MTPLVIAITGGSASGKSTFADALRRALDPAEVRLIPEDEYYGNHAEEVGFDPQRFNFDDITAHDHDLLGQHLRQLKKGKSVHAPLYDFLTHKRLEQTREIKPADVIIVEGIHVLADPNLRDLYDLTVFVEAPADIRLARRLLRDVRDRGRSVESVVTQYLRTVRPMHLAHTEPGRFDADIVIQNDAAAASPELEALSPSFDRLAAPAAAEIKALLADRV
ncbi:MAG: uridine kinase [Hyphobacterium sp.]|nr:MAG: uridine kinase [Hyphobacterium sp.]